MYRERKRERDTTRKISKDDKMKWNEQKQYERKKNNSNIRNVQMDEKQNKTRTNKTNMTTSFVVFTSTNRYTNRSSFAKNNQNKKKTQQSIKTNALENIHSYITQYVGLAYTRNQNQSQYWQKKTTKWETKRMKKKNCKL